MSDNNVARIPFALEAGSSQELSALMLENNMAHGKAFAYHITVKGNKFQAWYYNDADTMTVLSKELEKVKEGAK